MNLRAIVASAVAVLALTVPVVTLTASRALAASCYIPGGDEGDPLDIGCGNVATTPTTLISSQTTGAVLDAEGSSAFTGVQGVGADTGVFGRANVYGVEGVGLSGGTGVYGLTNSAASGATGVQGEITSSAAGGGSAGVRGLNDSTTGYGVGVWGSQAGYGIGVEGYAPHGTGIYGYSDTGVGVVAGGATALQVNGVASFSRSGLATVTAGSSWVTVTGVALTAQSLVLATVQQKSGGVYVKSAVPNVSGSSLTINVNKAPTVNVAVAWFVVN
jgi:hypothetical protein